MAIRINSFSNVNFSAKQQESSTNGGRAVAKTVTEPAKQNEYPGAKGFVARICNFYINATAMTKGLIKGIFDGAALGTIIAAVDVATTALSSKEIKFMDAIKHPSKALGRTGKVIAPLSALFVLGLDLGLARLHANKRTADVDHELRTGHRG